MGNVSSTSIVFITLLGQNPVLRQHRTAAAGGWRSWKNLGNIGVQSYLLKKKLVGPFPFASDEASIMLDFGEVSGSSHGRAALRPSRGNWNRRLPKLREPYAPLL